MLMADRQMSMDFIVLTPEQYERQKNIVGTIVRQADREGKVINPIVALNSASGPLSACENISSKFLLWMTSGSSRPGAATTSTSCWPASGTSALRKRCSGARCSISTPQASTTTRTPICHADSFRSSRTRCTGPPMATLRKSSSSGPTPKNHTWDTKNSERICWMSHPRWSGILSRR